MSKKRKKGINPRTKGKRLEYKVRDLLGEWTGLEFQRTPSSGAFGTVNSDMTLIGDVYTKDQSFPFCVECKSVEKWSLEGLLKDTKCPVWKFWRQATSQAYKSGKKPLLLMTKRNQPIYFVMERRHLPTSFKGSFFTFSLMHVEGIGRDCELAIGLMIDLTVCSYVDYLNQP